MNWIVENIEVFASAMVPVSVIVVLVGILIKTQVTRVFEK